MFKITFGKGFHMTFPNGVTVSVQFGSGNYCDNRWKFAEEFTKNEILGCPNAEVAVWDRDGNWILREYNPELSDDVDGWQTPEQVLALLNWAANYKGDN